MLMATGDVKWADKMESAVYNAALGAINKDFKALQYFSSPNQLLATEKSSMAPYGEEGLSRQAYRPGLMLNVVPAMSTGCFRIIFQGCG